MFKRILSIDPGQKRTGIYSKADGPWTVRFDQDNFTHGAYFKEMNMLSSPRLYDLILLEEGIFHMKSSTSVTIMAEIAGIIKACADIANIPWVCMPNQTWKAVIDFRLKKNTRAEIAAYLWKVEDEHGVACMNCDEADAFLQYKALEIIMNSTDELTKGAQRVKEEVLEHARKRDQGWEQIFTPWGRIFNTERDIRSA